MEIPILTDIVVILSLSVGVIFLFQKLRLPAILGFLITGIIAGPNGLKLIHGVHEVEMLAEIGVILLLFIIGMEFSLKTISAIQRIVLIGGFAQVGLTIGLTFFAAYSLGFPWNQAMFLGFLMSLSSTAIVLTLLQAQGAVSTPHGKIALAVLIFQDIIVVPMMLFTPLMAGQSEDIWGSLLALLLKAVLVVGLVIISARYLAPRLLDEVARTQNRELFLLSVLVICFAVAWGTSSIGLSLALGAFLAGLVISESEYSHQATALVIPFREIFSSFFFVSIGMLLDLKFFAQHAGVILLLALAVMLAKGMIAAVAALILRFPLRTALITGLSLFQIGEFAFILSVTGLQSGLLTDNVYQYFLAVSILSMAVTPFVMNASGPLADWLLRRSAPERLQVFDRLSAQPDEEPPEESLRDHVIIIGYGVTGRHVAEAARSAHIPYLVLDLDPERVARARKDGHPTVFGDATQEFVLLHVHVYSARVAVVAISDPPAARLIISRIRSICHTVYVIMRTRMVREADDFYRLGANEVVPEEFETSIEVFTRLLNRYFVPQDDIDNFVRGIRSEGYKMMRPDSREVRDFTGFLSIPDVNVTCLRVQHGENEVVGHSIAQSNIRTRFGVNLIGIMRDESFITNIQPETEIMQDDVLYLVGRPDDIAEFNKLIKY